MMRFCTFHHSVYGWFTLNRSVARYYSGDEVCAAIALILQSGE